MPFKGLTAFIPFGQRGMVNHENRLISRVDELLTAEGVTFEDDHIRREPGATAYDTAGLASVPSFSGTITEESASSFLWRSHLMAMKASASVAHVKTLGSVDGSASGGGTSIGLVLTVPTGGVDAGDLVVVAAACFEDDASGVIRAIVDSKGNTWTTQHSESTAAGGLTVFWSRITTPLVEAVDTITVGFGSLSTSDGLTATAVMVADQFTDVNDNPFDTESDGAGGTTAVSTPSLTPLSHVPSLLITSVGALHLNDSGAPSLTAAASFTKRTEDSRADSSGGTQRRVSVSISSRVDSTSPAIVALHDWQSGAEPAIAGTVSTTAGSQTVTGVGTTFTNYAVGDRIIISGETHIIEEIASATSLTTVGTWRNSNSGVTYKIRRAGRVITATSEGAIFKETPTTLTTGNLDATTLTSSLSKVVSPGYFVPAGKEAAAVDRKLFYFNGVDPVQVLEGDGATMAAIGVSAPTDWDTVTNTSEQPVAGTVHNNRLVAWGNLNDPHRLYFSDPDDHEDFTSAEATSLRVASNIGDRLFCGVSFQGVLFSWKYPRGIFYLDDSDLSATGWQVRSKSEALGCAPTPYAAVAMDDDVLFMAADGSFHILSAVSELGGVRASSLSHTLGISKWLRDNVNLSRLDLVVSSWHSHKKTAYFYVPGTDEITNTLCLKFDFGAVPVGGPVRFSFSERDPASAITLRQDLQGGPATPLVGEAGIVYLLDRAERNKESLAYPSWVQTPHMDFSDLDPSLRWKRKIYRRLELLWEPSDAAGTVDVEVYVDGTLKQELTFDPTERQDSRTLHVGDGRTISLVIGTDSDDPDYDFKALGAIVYFDVGNEDTSR